MKKFLCVSRWWGERYRKKADIWENTMKKLGIDYVISNETSMTKQLYQNGLNLKPDFVLKCLLKYKRPILYTDVDLRIYKYPSIFENENNVDVMLFNWNFDVRVSDVLQHDVLETSSWLLYFNYTPKAIKLLREWIKALKTKEFYLKADDRVLSMVFSRTNAKKWIKYQWVPFEYSYLPKYFKNASMGPIIMSHVDRLTSEAKATNDTGVCRIPETYDEEITEKLKHDFKSSYRVLMKIKHPHYDKLKKEYKKINIIK